MKEQDVPMGEVSWLTVVSPEDPDGTEVVLEPDEHPAVRALKDAIVADGIPWTSFSVDDVAAQHARLTGARAAASGWARSSSADRQARAATRAVTRA